MAASTGTLARHPGVEDVLAYLPVSSTTEYGKGQTIYGPNTTSRNIYLVVNGRVGTSQIAEDGREVLLEIVRPDELFGESAFLDVSQRSERATALETAKLMTWAVSEMEDLVTRRPRLAVALLQIVAQRHAELTRRIESLVVDNVERRLLRSLLRLSERFGAAEEDGSVRLKAFTHALLSQYAGTRREVVTQYMNRFRRQGYVDYSRHGIVLKPDTLRTLLEQQRIPLRDKKTVGSDVPLPVVD